MGTPIPDILTDYSDPPAGVTLETQLATLYGVEPDQVLVTAGASHADFLAAAASLMTNEETSTTTSRILVEAPGYEPLVKSPQAMGATVDRFRRTRDAEFRLDPDRIRNAVTEETALITVTNRHNPSGQCHTREELATIAAVAQDNATRLLVDEVYAPYVTDDIGDGPWGSPTAANLDNVVITNSLTKFMGLGDIRIGWLIADEPFINAARQTLAHIPTVAETNRALGRRTLHAHDSLQARSRELLADNAELLEAFIDDHPTLSGTVYKTTSFAVITHDMVDGDTLAATAAEAGILVVPGRFFDDPDLVRISLGRSPTECAASLQAFGAALDDLDSPS